MTLEEAVRVTIDNMTMLEMRQFVFDDIYKYYLNDATETERDEFIEKVMCNES
jgi:hypothetical protein